MTQTKTSSSSYPSIKTGNKSPVNIGNRTKTINSGVSKVVFLGICSLFVWSGLNQTSSVQQTQNVFQASPSAAPPISQSQSAHVNQTMQPTQQPQASKTSPKLASSSKPTSVKAIGNQKDCPDENNGASPSVK